MEDLNGKLAFITGGARGLGYAMGQAFAQRGTRVIVADLDLEQSQAAASRISEQYGVECFAWELDVRSCDAIAAVFDGVKRRFGKLDILVNNAGVQIREPSRTFSEKNWDALMEIDLKAVFFCSQQAVRLMEPGGAIVNLSSVNYCETTPGKAPYCIAKGGVNVMTAVLGAEWAADGIRVNAVAPGYVLTDMVREGMRLGAVSEKQLMAAIPFKRLAEPREIADAVVFLSSNRASYITGQTLLVDGGMNALGLPDLEG